MIARMRIFRSPWGEIELTKERKEHILFFHPEVASCLRFFPLALAKPHEMTSSRHDEKVIICYYFLAQRKTYLAIVIKLKPRSNFVLTAYLSKKIKKTL